MDIKFSILTIAIAFLITAILLLTISLAFAIGYLATIYILAVLNPHLFKHRKRGRTDLNDASPKHNPNNRSTNRFTYFWHHIRNSSLFKSTQHLGLSNIYFRRSVRGISYPLALCSKLINPANFSERGNPAPMLNARLPQKTPSASPGQARYTTTQQAEFLSSIMQELEAEFRKRHYQLLCAVLSYTEGLLALRCLSWP